MIFTAGAIALEGVLSAMRAGSLTVSSAYRHRDHAEHHGLLPLLADAALAADAAGDPVERAWLVRRLREAVIRDALQGAESRRVVDALSSAGVPTLVLKGEHVARVFYRAAHLRPHGDTDLLIHPDSRGPARVALEGLGYTLLPHVRGDAILAQMQFTGTCTHGAGHQIDVHWHALNPHPFRSLLPFEDAWGRSVPIDALGPRARGLCAVDALLLAATHLVVHHGSEAHLIWLADVDRLARALTIQEWLDFAGRARAAGVCAIARLVVDAAARFFETPVPPATIASLDAGARQEGITRQFAVPHSRARRLWLEVVSIRGWRTRMAVLYQHLVPDAAYMRDRYQTAGVGLAWAYVRRAAAGAPAWITRPTRPRPASSADPAPAGPPAGRGAAAPLRSAPRGTSR